MKNKDKTIININDDYFVEVDSYNYTLMENIITNKGKHTTRVIGYYHNLAHVLSHLKPELISCSYEEYTIDTYIKKLEHLEDWVSSIKEKR